MMIFIFLFLAAVTLTVLVWSLSAQKPEDERTILFGQHLETVNQLQSIHKRELLEQHATLARLEYQVRIYEGLINPQTIRTIIDTSQQSGLTEQQVLCYRLLCTTQSEARGKDYLDEMTVLSVL